MSSLQGNEILIVDDAEDYRLMARKILEGDGATVHTANDVDTAVALAVDRIPYLIITDLDMPGKTGFDLIQACKKMPEISRIPIIVLSGLSDKPSVYRAIAGGAVDYLLKPFRAALLLQKVKKALQSVSFRSYRFENDQKPEISLTVSADILAASEVGFLLESSLKLGADSLIRLESAFIDDLGCAHCSTKTTMTPGKYVEGGRYLNEINLIGIGEKDAKRIRGLLRKKG